MYKHARNYHTFTQKRFILVYPEMFIDVDSRFHGPKAKGVAAQWPLWAHLSRLWAHQKLHLKTSPSSARCERYARYICMAYGYAECDFVCEIAIPIAESCSLSTRDSSANGFIHGHMHGPHRQGRGGCGLSPI